jgi:hypothetical protein
MKKVPVPAVPTAAPTMKKTAKHSVLSPDYTADDPYAHMKRSLREGARKKDAGARPRPGYYAWKAKLDQQAVTKVVNTRPSEQIAQAGLERDARDMGPATPPPAPAMNVVNAPTTTNYVGQAGIAARRPIALSQRVKDF